MVVSRFVGGLAALAALLLAAFLLRNAANAHELKRVLENYSKGELAALSDDEIREILPQVRKSVS